METQVRLIRLPEVLKRTGYSRSSVYDRLNPHSLRHDPSFPKPVKIGLNAIAFVEPEVDTWIEGRIEARNNGNEGAAA